VLQPLRRAVETAPKGSALLHHEVRLRGLYCGNVMASDKSSNLAR